MVDDRLDEALLVEVLDRDAGEGSVDLHALDEDRLADHLEGRDLLHDAVKGRLVADDGVVGLVLDLALAPLLLLGGTALGLRSCTGRFRPVVTVKPRERESVWVIAYEWVSLMDRRRGEAREGRAEVNGGSWCRTALAAHGRTSESGALC